MSLNFRAESARHSMQTRVRARDLFLAGRTYAQITKILSKELARSATPGTVGTPSTSPPPPRIWAGLIRYWAEKGSWESERQIGARNSEREQVDGVRRDVSRQVADCQASLAKIEGKLVRDFLEVKKDEAGYPVLGKDGRPIMVPRHQDRLKVKSPTVLVRLLLRLVAARTEHIRLLTSLLGENLPGFDLETFLEASEDQEPPD